MSMRRMMPFTIVLLLLFQTIAVNFVVPAEAASGRGGTNDDYTVKSITVGNSSAPASQWVQSDGTVVDYIFIDQTVEVTISVQRFGGSAIPDEAPVALDIVHPIGFVMESFNFFTNVGEEVERLHDKANGVDDVQSDWCLIGNGRPSKPLNGDGDLDGLVDEDVIHNGAVRLNPLRGRSRRVSNGNALDRIVVICTTTT